MEEEKELKFFPSLKILPCFLFDDTFVSSWLISEVLFGPPAPPQSLDALFQRSPASPDAKQAGFSILQCR